MGGKVQHSETVQSIRPVQCEACGPLGVSRLSSIVFVRSNIATALHCHAVVPPVVAALASAACADQWAAQLPSVRPRLRCMHASLRQSCNHSHMLALFGARAHLWSLRPIQGPRRGAHLFRRSNQRLWLAPLPPHTDHCMLQLNAVIYLMPLSRASQLSVRELSDIAQRVHPSTRLTTDPSAPQSQAATGALSCCVPARS